MIERITNLLTSEDDQNLSFIKLTRRLLIVVMIATAVILVMTSGVTGVGYNPSAVLVLSISLLVEILAYIRLSRGNILFAKITVPLSLLIGISVIAMTTNGLRDVSILAIPVVIIISAIMLGKNALYITTPIAVILTTIVAIQSIYAKKIATPVGIDDAVIVPVLVAASSGITHLLIQRLNENISRAKESEALEKQENAELTALRANLEERIQFRTSELETANQIAEKQASQFQALARVTNVISSVQTLDSLLPLITQVISEQFNVYHVGIFLLDNQGEIVILRAANSTGGQKMMDNKYSLPMKQTGIIGYVTSTGQPRIMPNIEADSYNPELPNTRSAVALPLRYAGRIIGVLDVQSEKPEAFQPDDLAVFSTLSNQVAVAINNALTIEDAQRALAEAQSAIGQITQEAWKVLRPSKLGLGFTYSDIGIKPLEKPLNNEEINEVITKGKVLLKKNDDKNGQILAVPIRLRGQVIGVMQLKSRNANILTEDEADIAGAVAERLSLAIETATLLQSTQHRADIEKITAEITTRVSSSSRFENILQTAAQELSKALGGSEVLVQIEPAALKMYT